MRILLAALLLGATVAAQSDVRPPLSAVGYFRNAKTAMAAKEVVLPAQTRHWFALTMAGSYFAWQAVQVS
jgi:hypothetical protein